jgi:hypothetical protein
MHLKDHIKNFLCLLLKHLLMNGVYISNLCGQYCIETEEWISCLDHAHKKRFLKKNSSHSDHCHNIYPTTLTNVTYHDTACGKNSQGIQYFVPGINRNADGFHFQGWSTVSYTLDHLNISLFFFY